MNKKENHTDFKNKFKKLVAFSLAEVLITMGIIGVVAAITIPSLVSSIKKQQTETKLVKFYSSINQAIKLAEIQYGDKKDWDKLTATAADNVNWVNKYLKPYMNITKVEESGTRDAKVTLNDGTIFSIRSDVLSFFPQNCGVNCRYGIDIFFFLFAAGNNSPNTKYLYDKGAEPWKYDWNGTKEHLLDHSNYGCKTYSGNYCTALIQLNGWKIPSNYPKKF